MKLLTSVTLALVLALSAGWVWGASGKSVVEQERRLLEERADLAEARALVLDGRVSLFLLNFGDARRRFESAQAIVGRAQTRLRETSQAERAGQLEIVLAHLKDAGRLASALDQGAQSAADIALQTLKSLEVR
jgi:hypothetical protein